MQLHLNIQDALLVGNLRGGFSTAGPAHEVMDRPPLQLQSPVQGVTLGSLVILWNLSNNSIHQEEVLKDGCAVC